MRFMGAKVAPDLIVSKSLFCLQLDRPFESMRSSGRRICRPPSSVTETPSRGHCRGMKRGSRMFVMPSSPSLLFMRRPRKLRRQRIKLTAAFCSLSVLGCGDAQSPNNTSGSGGSGATVGTNTGGSSMVSAGGASSGGTPSSGGATPNGGAMATAGSPAGSGGESPTGGTSQVGGGGATASGAGGTAGIGGVTGGAGTGGNEMGGATMGGSGMGGADAGGSEMGGAPMGGSAGSPPIGDGGMPPVYEVEDTGADCPAPPGPPAFNALPAIGNLPDPFLMTDGTRITSRDQWRCRRAEISSIMQYWVSGPKGAPPSDLNATLSGNTLTVVATEGSGSITFTSTITTPSGNGPFPVVIGMNTATGSLPSDIFTSRGIATMSFNSSVMVPDAFNVPRGGGTYFTMYPDDNAGAMIEWAWGVSRLIDGLYATADQNNIDLKRIAVTGCSYQGKMALYAGAFDERIALVIPEESGGGGEASWRVMATQTGTEDLEEAQGTAWYAQNLKQFRNADAPKLPVDMHELVAMVAPRAILAIANTGIDRLASEAGSVSMKAATEVYKALGIPDRIGFTQTAASNHCQFPGSQTEDVAAFVEKFLLGDMTADTAIAKTPYNTDLGTWITWDTPQLN